MKIDIYRNNTVVLKLSLQHAVYSDRLMGDHQLVFSMQSAALLDLEVGDTLTYDGQVMTLNRPPSYEQVGDTTLKYEFTFQGSRHTLQRYMLQDEGDLTFSYHGDLTDYMTMFLDCVNAVDSGWTFGALEDVEPFSVSFDMEDCYTALNKIAEACGCEWHIKNKQIIIKETVGIARDLTFAYGKDNGLYALRRDTLVDSHIVTRAYAVGGSTNLPDGYAKSRLTLAGYAEDALAVSLYGIREGVYKDESIYPQRTSTITAYSKIDDKTFSVSDSTLDFDLNGQRIGTEDAKIVFKSGDLNGHEFVITHYNATTKTIRFKANEDANGGIFPFGLFSAAVGDSYTLVGIRMPSTYVDAALAALSAKRLEYLNSNKVPRVAYTLDADVLVLKRANTRLYAGDIIRVVDDKIGLDDNIRVTAVSYPAMYPTLEQGLRFTAEVGNELTYTRVQKIEKQIKETKEVITQVSKSSIEAQRRSVKALNEFKENVFDPDGNLQEAMTQAIAGLYGTDSMYYDLQDVTIAVNADSNPNKLTMTAGRLIHRRYEIPSLGYIWELSAFTRADLVPTQSYYLAAKVSRTTLTGEWVLTTDPMKVDAEVGYWYFNLGILSSVIEGARSFKPTKLYTLISGGNIETDVITAYLINVNKLFAQEITALNLNVSGSSTVGPFYVSEDGLSMTQPVGPYLGVMQLRRDGVHWSSVEQDVFPPRVAEFDLRTAGAIARIRNANNHSVNKGLEIDMGEDNVALNIISGKIRVDNKVGVTEKQAITTPSGTKYLNITSGLITSITYS